MKEKMKKIIFKWYGLAILVLMVTLTIFSFFAVVKIDIPEDDYPVAFQEGRYTSMIEDDSEIKIGFGLVFNAVKNFKDVTFVTSVQSLEKDIKETKIKIDDYENTPGFDEEYQYYVELKEELSLYEEELASTLASYKEEDINRLYEKLKNDKGFINVLKFGHAWLLDLEFGAPDGVPSSYNLDSYYVFECLASVFATLVILGATIIFVIIFFIKSIIKTINYLRRIKREYTDWFIKELLKFPIFPYIIILTISSTVLTVLSTRGVLIGAALIGAYIVLGLLTIVKLFKNYVFSEDKDIKIIVKKGIAVTSLILFVIFICTFIKIDLFKEYGRVMVDISDVQYKAEFDKGFAPDVNLGSLDREIYKKIGDSNDVKTTLIVLGSLAFSALCLVMLFRFIARARKEEFGYGKYLSKTKAIFVMPIILLVLSIIPTLLCVHSEKELTKAYENGMFKIWYDEHLQEGSEPYLEYKTLLLAKDATTEIIEGLKEEKDKDKEKIKEAKEYLAEVNKMIKEIEQRPKRPTTIIVMGGLVILLEIAYAVVPKYIGPKEEEKPVEEAQN